MPSLDACFWRIVACHGVGLARRIPDSALAGDVGAEGRVGDGDAVIVGEALPDHGGANRGVCVDHRVDVAVQTVQGRWLAVDLLACWRLGGGEGLDDGAAADVMLALDRPLCSPAWVSRRIMAYVSRLAARFRSISFLV
jgi:hypothetical protein